MAKKPVTSLELRKLIVELYKDDKISIWDISKTMGKSKSVIHCNLRKLEETASCEAKKPPSKCRKLLQGKTDGLVMNRKKMNL